MVMRKLRSRRGMSIIMGLLLLLVCVTAGAAALTSAASNAGRYTHMRRDQQRYLAVSSAARLVRDQLCEGEYNASASLTETYIHYTTTNSEGQVTWHTRGPDYTLEPLKNNSCIGAFSPWLQSHMDAVSRGEVASSDWWGLAGESRPASPDPLRYDGLSVQVDGEESQVQWSLEMGEDYGIIATFWLEEDGNRYYTTTLTIPAQTVYDETYTDSDTRTRSETVTTKTMTVTWPAEGAVIRQS